MERQSKIIVDPQTMVTAAYLARLAKLVGGDHNNTQDSTEEEERMHYYDKQRLEIVEKDVAVIKSNYLTKGTFYAACLTGFIILLGGAWSLDSRYEDRFTRIDQRFQQVDEKIHTLDLRLAKVEDKINNLEQKFDVVEKKIDSIDNKLDKLIQQKQAKK